MLTTHSHSYLQDALRALVLTHDCVNDKAPSPIKQLIEKEHEKRGITLRNHTKNPLNLKVPNLKTRVGTHSFSVKGPIFWNETPNIQKSVEKRETFKKVIKNNILKSYSSHCINCSNPMCRDLRHHH